MMPEHVPVHEGDVCWDVAYAERMLSPVSQVGSHVTDWFLATHSPITCNDRIGPVEELKLFGELFASSKHETLVVVKGDPGAGKSQLINWLKLRFDDAIARGERSGMGNRHLRSVLIRRESGSLKDALRQLVDQLAGYERYLEKIQSAIAGVSGEAAKRRLYTEMQHCLHQRREDAPRTVRNLDQVFNDNGTVERLCRPGGAIDRNIKRLVEQSDASAREALPPFTAEDFEFAASARVAFDGLLQDRLLDDEAVRSQAAAWANEHLRQAIAGLTGLRGHTLNEIFRDIREEMQRRGEALALFVEDVSTLSVLDEELVNALQPLNDPALCPLVSVLGMTLPAYNRLPDNLKGRLDRVLDLSGNSSLRLDEGGAEAADRFVARYLNGLRAGEREIPVLSSDVRSHGDQQHSACTDCPQKPRCFDAFGSISIGAAEVGLYPLAPGAAGRLLEGLRSETGLRTPRTLLQHVVLPLLKGMASGFRGGTVNLSVQPRPPRDLAAQQDLMLASWSGDQKGRTSYLLYYWTGHDRLVDGAPLLQSMLLWFGHPPFSQRVGPAQGTMPSRRGATVTPPPSPPTDKYDEAIARLDVWYQQQGQLEDATEYRRMLADMINKSLSMDDVRAPSQRVWRMAGSIDAGNIVIEGMVRKMKVGAKARFNFDRTADVYQLLKDLAGFYHLGTRSWRFEGGPEARRRYGHWLAQHGADLARAFDVTKGDRDSALRYGVRFLRLAYRFALRKDLPSDTGAAVEAIILFEPSSAVTLTPRAQVLVGSLEHRVREVRDAILEELAVRQGTTGGLNYIDPRPLIEHLSVGPDDLSLGEIDIETMRVDYPAIAKLAASDWPKLEEVLEEEKQALDKVLRDFDPLLRYWQLPAGELPGALREYLESARAVVKACEGAQQSLGDQTLQAQIRDLARAVVTRYVAPVERALQVLESSAAALLAQDLQEVAATLHFVNRVDNAMRRLQGALGDSLSTVVTEYEVQAERDETLAAVRGLMALDTMDDHRD